MVTTVADAVMRELARLAKRDEWLAESPLAASALALAVQMDDPGNSATSKANCARALNETLDRLRALAPPIDTRDSLDELGTRRAARLAGRAAP